MQSLTLPVRGDKFSMNWEIVETLFSQRSDYQQIDIVDTTCFGRALLLDGHIQFTLLDEFAYHETLVQIPALSLDRRQRALVVGGGDGGVVREIARHGSFERIDLVEIDPVVISACREHLPTLNGGAFEDSRVSIHVQDAFPFVGQAGAESYDLIILDSTDVYEEEEGEISEMLFTKKFFQDCFHALAPTGMVVTQADNLLFCPYSLQEIESQFRGVFPVVGSFWGLVPSFGGFSGFCYASKGARVLEKMPATELSLKYLNPLTWGLGLGTIPFTSNAPR